MNSRLTGFRCTLPNCRSLQLLLFGLISAQLLTSCHQSDSEPGSKFLCLSDSNAVPYAPGLKERVTYDESLGCKGVRFKVPDGALSVGGGRQTLFVQMPVPEQLGGIPGAQLEISGRAREPLEIRLRALRAMIAGPETMDIQRGRVHVYGYSKKSEVAYHFFYQVEHSDYVVFCAIPSELAASKPGAVCEMRNWRLGGITVKSPLQLSKIDEVGTQIDFVNKSVLQMISTN